MPIYEYKCVQCGNQVEKRQGVSDAPLTTCEKCHGKLEKQWSLSGFQFKGDGWYVTDYAGKKGTAVEKTSPSESTPKADTASNTSSDTKPAKTETASKPSKE